MRKLILPLAAACALSACGSSEEEQAAGGPVSAEDAAASMAQMETPRAGQYRTTAEVLEFEMPGLPAEQQEQFKSIFASGLAQANTYCLTAEDAENGAKQLAEGMAEGDCTFNALDISGNTLDADMVCKDESGREGNVKLAGTMSSEGADMTMEMDQSMEDMPGGSVRMKMRMVSERIGDCEG